MRNNGSNGSPSSASSSANPAVAVDPTASASVSAVGSASAVAPSSSHLASPPPASGSLTADRLGLNYNTAKTIIENDERARIAALTAECRTFLSGLDLVVETQVLPKLDHSIRSDAKLVDLKASNLGGRLDKVVDLLKTSLNPAQRKWGEDLKLSWNEDFGCVWIKEPIMDTELSGATTIVSKFIRRLLTLVLEDSDYLKNSSHYFYDPREVLASSATATKATAIPASDFRMEVFNLGGQTRHKKLSEGYEDIARHIVNYAQKNRRNRTEFYSPDMKVLKLIMDRLSTTLNNIESNMGKEPVLKQLGQLMIFVKALIRIQAFNTRHWALAKQKQAQNISVNGASFDETGNLTMTQVLQDIEGALRQICFAVQEIVDNLSIGEYAGQLVKHGHKFRGLRHSTYGALSKAGSFATNPDEVRQIARESQLGIKSEQRKALTSTQSEKLEEPAFDLTSLPQSRAPSKAVVLTNSKQVMAVSAIGEFSPQGKALMIKYNPSKFAAIEHFHQFADDIHAILVDMFPPLHNDPDLQPILRAQAEDYGQLLTLIHKLEAKLINTGELLIRISRYSGEFELYLYFKEDIEDACTGLLDMFHIAETIIDRINQRTAEIYKSKNRELQDYLFQNKDYQSLFTGKGAKTLAEMTLALKEMNATVLGFRMSLQNLTREKFEALLLKQMRDGYELSNVGYHLGKDLYYLAQISGVQGGLKFNFDRHREIRPLDFDNDFNRGKLQTFANIQTAGALPSARASTGPGLLAIAGAPAPASAAALTPLPASTALPAITASPARAPAPTRSVADLVTIKDTEEMAKLRAENKALREEILAFNTPRLQAGYLKTLSEEMTRIGQDGSALLAQAKSDDELASLRATNQVLNYALSRAWVQLADFRKDAKNEAQVYLAKFLKDCEGIPKKLFETQVSVVYKKLQEALEEAQTVNASTTLFSVSDAAIAERIYKEVGMQRDMDLLDFLEGKFALKEDERLGSASLAPPSRSLVSNNNNAVAKPQPTQESLETVKTALTIKPLFEKIVKRIETVYMNMYAEAPKSSGGLFSRSQSPSVLEDYKLKNFGKKKPLCPKVLYKSFLKELAYGEFTEENIKNALRAVLLRDVFGKFAKEHTKQPHTFLASMCAGFIVEMSCLVAEGDDQDLSIHQKSPDQLKSTIGANAAIFCQNYPEMFHAAESLTLADSFVKVETTL